MKGQVEIAVVGIMIALVLLVPSILVFGVSPRQDLDEQIMDIEPFMESTALSSTIRKSYINTVHRNSIEMAFSEILEEPLEYVDLEDFKEQMENRTAEIAAERILGVYGEEECHVSANPEFEVNIGIEECGLEAEFINVGGGPMEVSCEGDSAEYTKHVSLDNQINMEELVSFQLVEAIEHIREDEGFMEFTSSEKFDFYELESEYETFFKEETCLGDVEVIIDYFDEDRIILNVFKPGESLFGDEGFVRNMVTVMVDTEGDIVEFKGDLEDIEYILTEYDERTHEEDEEFFEEFDEEYEEDEEVEEVTEDQEIDIIVVDPGHGGKDPGATGFGITEADKVLEMSVEHIAPRLEEEGYDVILTRNTDEFISIYDRSYMAYKNDADLFISVHLNGYDDPSAEGSETLYPAGSSPHFAETIHSNIMEYIEVPDRGIKPRDNLGVLNRCNQYGIDAVLIEPAFITNPGENELVRQESFHEAVAEGVVDGVKDYDQSN